MGDHEYSSSEGGKGASCIGGIVFFGLLIGFPVFLTMTILSSKMIIYPCKIVSFLNSTCIDGGDSDLSMTLNFNISTLNNITNMTEYHIAHYYCHFYGIVHCRLNECINGLENGKEYQCFYTKISNDALRILKHGETYSYSSLFIWMLVLCILSSILWLCIIYGIYSICKDKSRSKDESNSLL